MQAKRIGCEVIRAAEVTVSVGGIIDHRTRIALFPCKTWTKAFHDGNILPVVVFYQAAPFYW